MTEDVSVRDKRVDQVRRVHADEDDRDAEAQILLTAPGMRHTVDSPLCVVEQRGHAEEQSGPVGLDRGEQGLGRRAAGEQHARRARPEREREAVAEPVGVEQLRRREGHVVWPEAEHPLTGNARFNLTLRKAL